MRGLEDQNETASSFGRSRLFRVGMPVVSSQSGDRPGKIERTEPRNNAKGNPMISAEKDGVIKTLEGLSEVIIETLKELSTNRQPLTLSFLTNALSKRDEVQLLLSPAYLELATASEKEKERGFNAPGEVVQAAGPNLRQAVEEKEQSLRLASLWKRSIFTLMSLADIPETGPIADAAKNFKRALTENEGANEVEKLLSSLRNAIVHAGEKSPKSSGDGVSVQASAPKDRNSRLPQAGAAPILDKDRLLGFYAAILSEFNVDLGEDYIGQVYKIQRKIDRCADTGQLLEISDEFIGLLQAFSRIITEERLKVTDLIAEIGGGLIAMENQFVSSMTHTAQTHDSNAVFNNTLESQMEDLKQSAQFSNTLIEFKGLLFSKLASIKEALEAKRNADQERQEAIYKEMRSLQTNLRNMKKEVEHVQEKRTALEREILIGPLTGIPNRRGYTRRINEEMSRFHRYQQGFALLLLDIDHFKDINDKYGHWAGDKCLKELIKRITPTLRESDFLARYGGEEFIAILPGADSDAARLVAERVCRTVSNTQFVYRKQEINLTISIGVCHSIPGDQTHETIFRRVDTVLYEAKRAGRNRVMVAAPVNRPLN